MRKLGLPVMLSAALVVGSFAGCAATSSASASTADAASTSSVLVQEETSASESATGSSSSGSVLETADLFTERDLNQQVDTSSAKEIAVESGQDVAISEEGVYVISGTASDCTITVDADSSAKVQLVLDGVNITNSDSPAIFVASADKVFATTASGSDNSLVVTGAFATTADDNFDGVVYAKDDVVFNGLGTLTIQSSDNGIVGKDDVKVTGGTYKITAEGHGIEGKDSVAIADGELDITAGTDAIHAENADDQQLGYVYVAGGTFNLNAGSDGIEGDAVVQIDDGTFSIESAEGIEGTYVQVNGGTIDIQASDDGINATSKSTEYDVVLEINGGDIAINMGQGDTDALDSNGDLLIHGGTVDITAQFAFDFDGTAELSGGEVYVNGERVTEIENSMMEGPGGMDGAGSRGAPRAFGDSGSMGGPSAMGDRSAGSRASLQ